MLSKYHEAWSQIASRHADDLATAKEYRQIAIHPDLFSATLPPEWFAPALLAAFSSGPPPPHAVRSFVNEVSPGIYAFDMFTDAFCERLLCELEH